MSLAIKASRAGVTAGALSSLGRNVGARGIPTNVNRVGFQGDPGLFGFLGKAAGFAAGALSGGLTGIAGRILGGGVAAQGGPGGSLFQENGAIQFPPVLVPKPGVGGFFERLVPGGESGFLEATGTCPTGQRPNKSSYFLKDGTFVEKGSRCVTIRRTNPLNPRALSRSIRRIEGAKKKEQVLKRITIRCKPHGKASCPSCR